MAAFALGSGCRDGAGGAGGDGETDSAGTAEDGGDGDGADAADESGGEEAEVPEGIGRTGIRRLTVVEYNNTIADLLLDESAPGTAFLPEDKKLPFDNDYTLQSASRVLIEGAETLAGSLAESLVADASRMAAVVGCTPSGADDVACMTSFVESFGRRALRRPLTPAEVDELVALGLDFAEQGGGFDTGVEQVVRALLQDAEFIYRVELGTPVEGAPGVFRLGEFEIATRMSYFAWGSTPDDVLLNLAASGALSDPDERRAAMATLLEDPRARRQVDRFHALWLGYHELPHTPELVFAMRTETANLIHRIVFDEQRPWTELFTSTETWVDDLLAFHYELPYPEGGEGWVDYGDSGRQGILSHGSFLSVAGNPGDTSPTKRGKLIRNRLLCQVIPPPPPDAPADEPPSEEAGECKTDQYAAHREPGSCKGCHDQMDPIGFGLENYDLAGRYREHDDGNPACIIEGEGELTGIGTFSGPAELSDLVLANGLDGCVVEQLYSYAMGHAIGVDDVAYTQALTEGFSTADHHFDELLLQLVEHPAFAYRMEEE